MLPELKQAIIKHLPDYFSWNQDRQEQYRVNIPEQDYLKIEQFLLKALFDITVTDKEGLKKIHFKTFMRDCWDIEQKDHSGFIKKIDDEKQKLRKFLDTQYHDIMVNFDPNVLKFRKKYTIVCHKDSGLI